MVGAALLIGPLPESNACGAPPPMMAITKSRSRYRFCRSQEPALRNHMRCITKAGDGGGASIMSVSTNRLEVTSRKLT